jgi:hypothetical protein
MPAIFEGPGGDARSERSGSSRMTNSRQGRRNNAYSPFSEGCYSNAGSANSDDIRRHNMRLHRKEIPDTSVMTTDERKIYEFMQRVPQPVAPGARTLSRKNSRIYSEETLRRLAQMAGTNMGGQGRGAPKAVVQNQIRFLDRYCTQPLALPHVSSHKPRVLKPQSWDVDNCTIPLQLPSSIPIMKPPPIQKIEPQFNPEWLELKYCRYLRPAPKRFQKYDFEELCETEI